MEKAQNTFVSNLCCVCSFFFTLRVCISHNIFLYKYPLSPGTITTLRMTSKTTQDTSLVREECPSDTTFTPPEGLGYYEDNSPETPSMSVTTQHKPEEMMITLVLDLQNRRMKKKKKTTLG